MSADPNQVIANLRELAALTSDATGAQRIAFTPTWQRARDWFAAKLTGLPGGDRITRHLDAAGNVWVTLPGASPKALVLGSHLDSVPNGGWLDGALGVVTALEVLTAIARDTNGRPPFTVRLVDWADEEGARFGRSLFGSSAFAGTHSIAADRVRTDRDGVTLEAALAACNIDIAKIGDAAAERENIAAYLELHIEQGPVLERLGLPLAAVLGTKGVERHAITFHGQEAHSGSTPMADRRDALATMYREAQDASLRFASEERCTVEWSRIWSIEPIPFHPALITLCQQAIAETVPAGTEVPSLPSGPLHDAAEVSRAGIPTVMMFVQSLRGISHNKIEDTSEAHLRLAVAAYDRLAAKTLAWMASQ